MAAGVLGSIKSFMVYTVHLKRKSDSDLIGLGASLARAIEGGKLPAGPDVSKAEVGRLNCE